METQQGTFQTRERVKLLAYEDTVLERQVFVDLVAAPDAGNLEELAESIHLGDLVDFVRRSHEKLPAMLEITEAELEQEIMKPDVAEHFALDIPGELLKKRFVFPAVLGQTIGKDNLAREGLNGLKNLLIGRGEGSPFMKLGILGRAAVEEQTGTGDLPFYYTTLVLLVRYLGENIRHQLLTIGKTKEGLDEMRRLLQLWTSLVALRVHRAAPAERLLSNPLAPYALNRRTPPMPVGEATAVYLSYPNEYALTPDLARALDEHLSGRPEELAESEEVHETLRRRVAAIQDLAREATALKDRVSAVRIGLSRVALVFGAAFAAGLIVPWLFSPLDAAIVLEKLHLPGTWPRLLNALTTGGAAAAFLALANWTCCSLRVRLSSARRSLRRALKRMRRNKALRRAFARALAREELIEVVSIARRDRAHFTLEELKGVLPGIKGLPARAKRLQRLSERARRPSRGAWRTELPRLLWNYLKLKNDQLDYLKLSRIEMPAIDSSDLYQEDELKRKWNENACVCYDNDFPTLIIGAAKTAAVYFIDVAGSTEISSRQNLSNTLELYSRVLTLTNEAGGNPIWRKEVGDGRYYCFPTRDALHRAVLTAQVCAHPKIGVQAGVGLSVSEIYTDVTTGDFLNEAANRASRLNGRDDLIGAYIDARYIQKPFRVFVKYGRLHNTGVALDEKALRALGVGDWQAIELVPPFQWRFPVIANDGSSGTVELAGERIPTRIIDRRLEVLGAPPQFQRHRGQLDQSIAVEVFCHKSDAALEYSTPVTIGSASSLAGYLGRIGVRHVAYSAGEASREDKVKYLPVSLPNGQSINLVVKHQKALLKGLGACAVAEVDLPKTMELGGFGRLEQFLSSL